jgi:hypothetical protein
MASRRGVDLTEELERLAQMPARTPVQARLRGEACSLIRAEQLVAAAFTFRFVDLQSYADGELSAGGERLYGPRLVPAEGRLTALACGVATIGDAVERRVSGLFAERKPALALALDEIGNQLLFEVSRRLQDRMFAHAIKVGVVMAGELRAGDPGLDITYQPSVVRLAEGASIGVNVSVGMSLTPLKSTAMVMGAGFDLPPATWSRCDDCSSKAKCKLVRAQGGITEMTRSQGAA